jgi:MarR family transcriptional regulator, 2-MHQ and catechol-resistance regulon repressor
MPRASSRDALITTFGRLVEAHDVLARRLSASLELGCGIPLTWFEVLLRISRADQQLVSMTVLAEQVSLTTGGVTRLLDRMIAAGLVTRVPCPSDRRISYAALTEAGAARLTEALAIHRKDLSRSFDGFSAIELAQLDGLMDRLRHATPEQ